MKRSSVLFTELDRRLSLSNNNQNKRKYKEENKKCRKNRQREKQGDFDKVNNKTHKTKQPTPHLLPTEVEQEEDKTMDVTFVLEESGVTATVEVPCEAKVAAAKEVACTALSVSPASVEMRIGTQVLEGTCRLQDTAFGAGVQVVLARRTANIKCPAEYTATHTGSITLSRCGTLCIYGNGSGDVVGVDTETFDTVFSFEVDSSEMWGPPAISPCKTRCYVACGDWLLGVALPGGEVLREVDGDSYAVFACGSVVVSKGKDGVSVYDEDLTLLRTLSHEACVGLAVSDCGGWVITSSENVRLWDVNTGEVVACVPTHARHVAISRSASVFALEVGDNTVHLYDWSGAALRSVDMGAGVRGMQFTPCGKYVVVQVVKSTDAQLRAWYLHQYELSSMSCVHEITNIKGACAISPCSRVLLVAKHRVIVTRHLYAQNSE